MQAAHLCKSVPGTIVKMYLADEPGTYEEKSIS